MRIGEKDAFVLWKANAPFGGRAFKFLCDVEGVGDKTPGKSVGKIVLQCFLDGPESQFIPGDFVFVKQAGF